MKVTMTVEDMFRYYCMHDFYMQHFIGLCYSFINENQMSYAIRKYLLLIFKYNQTDNKNEFIF